MPKLKTNSSAKKRFALTGSGKIKAQTCLQESHPHEEDEEAEA